MEPTPKNKGKKSLFMRFKPVLTIDHCYPLLMPKRNASDPVLSYIAIADKDGAVLPAMLSSVFGAGDDRGEKCGCRRRKWLALRAAFNDTSLMRMVIKRKKANKHKFSRSISNLEETSSTILNPKCKSTCRTMSNVSSTFRYSPAFTSSSPTSNVTSSPSSKVQMSNGTGVTKQKQCDIVERKKGHYGSNIVLFCMFLITLLILILWGKFLAILFTSMWLYLVPHCRRKPCNKGGLRREREFKLVQNKVVTMEGVLGSERSHTCVSLMSKP